MRIGFTGHQALVIAICLSAFSGLSISAGNATSTAPPVCAVENLSLGIGQRLSPMTQEMGDIYTLTNHAKFSCFLLGYPKVSYYDITKHVLPFLYTKSSSIYMTHIGPKPVLLLAGGRGFFMVAGSTCQEGKPIEAVTIRVQLPNAKKLLNGRVTASPGVGSIYYCKGAPNHYERQLDVSPVRANSYPF